MLSLNVKRVMRLRGVENQRSLLDDLEFAPATARRLLAGDVLRIELEDLEKLCIALKCTPNDLLDWTPPESLEANASGQALHKLTHDPEDITRLLGSLPLEKVQALADELRQSETK